MAPRSRRALLECPAELRVADEAGNTAILYRRALLGRGGFATVYEAQQGLDGPLLALKVISRALLSRPKDEQKLQLEIALHEQLSHHHIVRCLGHFVDDANIYLMLEHCSGVTVDDVVRHQGRLTEQQAAEVLLQVLPAVQYLHRRNILHRDLKLSNLLLDKQHRVKLSDFGLAAQVCAEQRRMSLCGTLNYMAPEVLQRPNPGHGVEVDIWALGVMLYTMLVGQTPFKGGSVAETHQRIQAAAFTFPPDVPLSDDARSLISSILKTSPVERPSLGAIFKHPFLRRYRKRAAGGSHQGVGSDPAASCDSWGSSLTASYEPHLGMPGAAWEVGTLDMDHTPSTGPITPSSGWRGMFMPSSTLADLLPGCNLDASGSGPAAGSAAVEAAGDQGCLATLPSPTGSSSSNVLEAGAVRPVLQGPCSINGGTTPKAAVLHSPKRSSSGNILETAAVRHVLPGPCSGSGDGALQAAMLNSPRARPPPGVPQAVAAALPAQVAAPTDDSAGAAAAGPGSPYSSCNTAMAGMRTPVGSPQGGSSVGSSHRLASSDAHRRGMAWVVSGGAGEGCGSSSGGSGGGAPAAPSLLSGRMGSLGVAQEGPGALAFGQAGPSKQQASGSSGCCEDTGSAAGKGRCDMCFRQPEPCLRCSYARRCSISPAGVAGSSSCASSSQPSPAYASLNGLFGAGAGASLSYLMPDVVASSLSQPTAGKRGDQVQQSLLAACSKQPSTAPGYASIGDLSTGPLAARQDVGVAPQQQQQQQQQVFGSQVLGLAGLSGTASAMTGFAQLGPWQPWPVHIPGSPSAPRQGPASLAAAAAAAGVVGSVVQRPLPLPGLSARSSPGRCESPVPGRLQGSGGSGTVHSPVPPAVPPSPHQRHAAAARRRSLNTASPAPPSSPPGPAGLRTPKAAHVSFWNSAASAHGAAAPQGGSPHRRWQTSTGLPAVAGMAGGAHLHQMHSLSNGSTGHAGGAPGGSSSGGATPVSGFQMPPDFKAIRDQLQDTPATSGAAVPTHFSSVAVLTLQPVFGSLSVCSTPSLPCGSGSAGTTHTGSPLRQSGDALGGASEVQRYMRRRLSSSPAGTPCEGQRPTLAEVHEQLMRQQQHQRRQHDQQAAQQSQQQQQQHGVPSSGMLQQQQQQRSMQADSAEQQAGDSRHGAISGLPRPAAPPHPPLPPGSAAANSSAAAAAAAGTYVPATPQTPRWVPHPPEGDRGHPAVRASPAPPMQGKPVTASPAVARRTYTQVGTAASPRLGVVGGYMSPRAWSVLSKSQSLPAPHMWPPVGGVLGQGSQLGMASGSVLGAPGELVFTPDGLTPELHRLGLPPPAFTQTFGLDVGHELGSPDDHPGEPLSPFSAAVVAQPLLRAAGFPGQAVRADLAGGGSAMLELQEVIQRGQELQGLSVSCVRPPVSGLCAASFNLLQAPDYLAPVRVGPPVPGCGSGTGTPVPVSNVAGHTGSTRPPLLAGGAARAPGVARASSAGVLEALRGVLTPADRPPGCPPPAPALSASASAAPAADRTSPAGTAPITHRAPPSAAQPAANIPAEQPPASPVAAAAAPRPPDMSLVPVPPGQAVPVCSSPCIRRLLEHCASAGSSDQKGHGTKDAAAAASSGQ